MRKLTAFGLISLLLTACDSSDSGGPGGVSAGEAEALDRAAEMLDAQRLPEGALPTPEDPLPESEQGAADVAGSSDD